MDIFEIRGGKPLMGQVTAYGAKNAALPILAATVMVEDVCVIEDVPDLEDVRVMLDILRILGSTVEREGSTIRIDSKHITQTTVPSDLMRKMRSPMNCKVMMKDDIHRVGYNRIHG